MARTALKYDETSIKRLKGLDGIRAKPTMYLGEQGDPMVFQAAKELVANCVVGNTLVCSDKGILPIRKFTDLRGKRAEERSDVLLADVNGSSKSSHVGFYGVQDTMTLVAQSGHHVTGSTTHPMLSYDAKTLTLEYKELAAISTGDYVAIKLGANVWSSSTFKGVSVTKARVLGYLVAEGYFARMLTRGSVVFANNDTAIIDDFLKCLKSFSGFDVTRRLDKTGCTHLTIKGPEFISELTRLGISPKWKSDTVRIPTSIMQSPKKYMLEFLRAYYEGDGSVISGRVEAATKSRKLSNELQVVLGNLGILAKIQLSVENGAPFYKVWIAKHRHAFMQIVGFVSYRKNSVELRESAGFDVVPGVTKHIQQSIKKHRCGSEGSAWYHTEEGGKKRISLNGGGTSGINKSEFTIEKLNKVLNNLECVDSDLACKIREILSVPSVVWVKVKSLNPGKPRPVFDFRVPATRSFIANGLVSSNCVDEFFAGRNSYVFVHADNATGTYIVADKADGVPVGLVPSDPENPRSKKVSTLTLIFTEIHTGGKFDNKAYSASQGTHGIGASATNAVSASFEVWTHRDRKWHHQKFACGKPTTQLTVVKFPSDVKKLLPYNPVCGTVIRFKPDQTVVSKDKGKTKAKLDVPFTARWMRDMAMLNPGLELVLSSGGKVKSYLNKEGLIGIIKSRVTALELETIGKPFIYTSDQMSIALQWSSYSDEDGVNTYVNSGITRDGGEHEVGVRNTLTKALIPYKRKTEKYAPKDLYYGLLGVINYKMSGAAFSGQTKDRLTSNVAAALEKELLPALSAFFAKNKSLARTVIRRAMDVKKSKDEFKRTLDAVANAKRKSKSNLPSSLVQAPKANASNREIFIVEGDSASGTSKKARDPNYQEVARLTGKIANAAKMKLHKLMESKAIQDILTCIGYNFDSHKKEGVLAEDKLRVSKIFLLPDADVDGDHISVVLLTLLHKMMPRLFDEGRVYIVDAPLFGAYYKGVRYHGATHDSVAKQLPKGAKTQVMRSKGWGEISHETLAVVAFNPKTRTTIQVKPVKGKELKHFEALVGNDTLARKELLGL